MKRSLMGAGVLALAMALMAPAWGQVTYKDVVALDFAKTDDQGKFQINGAASFADKTATIRPPATPRLRLMDANSQASSAFLTTSMGLPTYRVQFDFQAQKSDDADGSTADGFAFVVQAVGADVVQDGGSGIGYARSQENALVNQYAPRVNIKPGNPIFVNYAVEFNIYANNGLVGNAETIALDILGLRTKIGQMPLPVVGKGVFHAQIDGSPDQIVTTITGGDIAAGKSVVLASPVIKGFFADPKDTDGTAVPLFFGFSGGTGGLHATVEILNFRLQVPS